jgi:ABC-type phosphate transport system permease subunit
MRIKPAVEMMAGLPSVVLGFLAALVLAPLVCGEEVFVRELRAMSAFRWQAPKLSADATPPATSPRASADE